MNEIFNENLPDIAGRLKAVRKALNLSLDKISQLTGFSKSLISEAENGKKKPSSIYLFGLIDLFKVNVNYVLAGEGSMFLDTEKKEIQVDDDDMRELFLMMNKLTFVKYSVLSLYIDFKTRNKDVIGQLLNQDNTTDGAT